MVAETKTITDFLLERIAEDEAQANNVLVFRMNPRTRMPGNQAIPDRVRAECAAKRVIIARYVQSSTRNPYDHALRDVMHDLAAIYAHHPDYQQEWAV